jgi:hypothetical protein
VYDIFHKRKYKILVTVTQSVTNVPQTNNTSTSGMKPSINCSFVYKAKEGRHVRIVICVCLCIVVSNTLCCVFLHLAYLLLPVSLDCPFILRTFCCSLDCPFILRTFCCSLGCPFGILQRLFTKQATQTPLKTIWI